MIKRIPGTAPTRAKAVVHNGLVYTVTTAPTKTAASYEQTAEALAVTVGAGAAGQAVGHAVGAEGALERADHGVRRVGGQVLVAAFAVGLELEHRASSQSSVRSSLRRIPTIWLLHAVRASLPSADAFLDRMP